MSGFTPHIVRKDGTLERYPRMKLVEQPRCDLCDGTNSVTRIPDPNGDIFKCTPCQRIAARFDAANHALRTQHWADQGPFTA